MEAVRPASETARRGNVYLLRGWQDLYSQGIDQLADSLRREGVEAQVFRAGQWRELGETISHRYAGAGRREPLVLIGFSYGADDVVQIADQLKGADLTIDLLITIDPVTPAPVPENVRVGYNFFQSNGVWDAFPWFRGVPLQPDGNRQIMNIDIRRQRTDLLEPDTAHSNIAANPKIHREIIRRVLEVCGARGQ